MLVVEAVVAPAKIVPLSTRETRPGVWTLRILSLDKRMNGTQIMCVTCPSLMSFLRRASRRSMLSMSLSTSTTAPPNPNTSLDRFLLWSLLCKKSPRLTGSPLSRDYTVYHVERDSITMRKVSGGVAILVHHKLTAMLGSTGSISLVDIQTLNGLEAVVLRILLLLDYCHRLFPIAAVVSHCYCHDFYINFFFSLVPI